MASFAAGVTVVTTVDAAGNPFGLTATAFSSASREPPLCLVCIGHAAEAHPALLASRRFAINFLALAQHTLSARFATHGLDKFDGVPYADGTATGCPILEGTLGYVECTVRDVYPVGDHDVIVGLIERVETSDGTPLVYFRGRYHELLPH
jgi:flavin reductase (DIM6/NTAB) family NADH-FMN oxidoreductase RutF